MRPCPEGKEKTDAFHEATLTQDDIFESWDEDGLVLCKQKFK
jgi:hypothetical protein